jgi:Chemoreceptor zinc-binding domain
METALEKEDLVKQIDDALLAHHGMKRALTLGISLHDSSKTPEELRRHDHCAFGRWLNSYTLDDQTKASKPYQVVSRLHREFHEIAGEVASLADAGKQLDAFALLDGEYSEKSERLELALNKWRAENIG